MTINYIKVQGENLWGKESLEKQDLIDVSQGRYDTIIDIHGMKTFDARENSWKEIPHE